MSALYKVKTYDQNQSNNRRLPVRHGAAENLLHTGLYSLLPASNRATPLGWITANPIRYAPTLIKTFTWLPLVAPDCTQWHQFAVQPELKFVNNQTGVVVQNHISEKPVPSASVRIELSVMEQIDVRKHNDL